MDVIRGVALFGVLMMNLAFAFRLPFWGIHPEEHDVRLDHVVMRVESILLSGKARTLFTILFGIGLAIFLERAKTKGRSATGLLTRRLFFLLAFGLAHVFLVWNGDILVSYAVVGFIAMGFMHQRTAVLYATIAACLVYPALATLWPALMALANTKVPGHYEQAFLVYGSGTYLDVVRFRAYEFFHLVGRGHIIFWSSELANMLVGFLIWRSGVLRSPEDYRRPLRWVASSGIAIGFGYALYRAILSELHRPSAPSAWQSFFSGTALLSFALGYGAGILLLLQRANWRRWLGAFAPLGRMAFTNYLTQSIVFSTVFYGYGFGLLGKVGYAGTAMMGIACYILQGIASTVWLRHFQFGPFEWAWRSLTYGTWQPLSRTRPQADP